MAARRLHLPEVVALSGYALVLSEAEVRRFRMMAARARTDEADLWALAGIVSGASVADVGCGPGAVLQAMAEVVGPTGRVVGIDADPAAVQAAVALGAASNLDNLAVQLGQATDSGLAPGFDAVMMRHVLAHNGGREQDIVSHLASLVRPGGCVYLVDVEMTAVRARGAEPDLMDLMERYTAFHKGRGNDTQIGLRLGELLGAAGLDVLVHRGTYTVMPAPPGMRPPAWVARDAMVAEGIATPEDVARWQAALDRLDAAPDRPVMFMPMFTAVGRRPN